MMPTGQQDEIVYLKKDLKCENNSDEGRKEYSNMIFKKVLDNSYLKGLENSESLLSKEEIRPEITMSRLVLRRIIRENHHNPIRQIIFNSDSECQNLVACIADVQVTKQYREGTFDIRSSFSLSRQIYMTINIVEIIWISFHISLTTMMFNNLQG
jgi:hypothetical protein